MWDQDLFQHAWDYACNAHGDQKVPGSDVPYINHIGLVVAEIMSHFHLTSPNFHADLAVVVACLHDVIEDTDQTYNDILKRFGKPVANGVLALTKDETIKNKEAAMEDSLERILACPPEIAAVKMADRIANLRVPPRHWNETKIGHYRREAERILEVLGAPDPSNPLAIRLAKKITNYPPIPENAK